MGANASSVGIGPHKDKEKDHSVSQRQRRQKAEGGYWQDRSGAYSVSKHVTQEMSFQGHSSSGFLGGAVPVIAVWPLERVTHLSPTQPSSLTIDGGGSWWRHMLYIQDMGLCHCTLSGFVSGGGLTL